MVTIKHIEICADTDSPAITCTCWRSNTATSAIPFSEAIHDLVIAANPILPEMSRKQKQRIEDRIIAEKTLLHAEFISEVILSEQEGLNLTLQDLFEQKALCGTEGRCGQCNSRFSPSALFRRFVGWLRNECTCCNVGK